jgi:hypothetical protein
MEVARLIMRFFGLRRTVEWSRNDEGLAIFFCRSSDFILASSGRAKGEIQSIWLLFEQLLECGEARVETTQGGIFIGSADAVRLDPATRDKLHLPPQWPGHYRLETRSIPNLSDFGAVLRLVDVDGRSRTDWKLKGPILEVGEECYLPGPAEFACLRAYSNWHKLSDRSESCHLRLIHVLADAAEHGCRIDMSSVGKVNVMTASECVVDAKEQVDGSILLTPVPVSVGLASLLATTFKEPADSSSFYQRLREYVSKRIWQLDGESSEAILRIGSTITVFDQKLTRQVRGIVKNRLVPPEQGEEFRRDPSKWLADHVFVHGEVEFLPRVIGIGEWSGGYLGSAGELGEKIDWFDKQPEAKPAPEKTSGGSMGSEEPSTDLPAEDTEEDQGPLVTIIEKNDSEVGWGLRGNRRDDPDTIRFRPHFDSYSRKPFPHQEEAVLWLEEHAERCGPPVKWEKGQKYWGAGALLADDMGLGKTFSTLLFLGEWQRAWRQKTGEPPPACLIVCPLSLVENWRDEIESAYDKEVSPFSRIVRAVPDGELGAFFATSDGKDRVTAHAPELELSVEQYGLSFGHGCDASLDKPGTIVLTTYTTLRDYRFSFAGCHWSAVIFDEAQNIKNPNALQTIASKSLKGFFRIALSGTPVENHLGDLWSLMDTVEPGALGSFQDFRSRWIRPIRDNPAQLEVFGEKLRKQLDPLILRRTKEQSLKGLPSKHLIPVRIKMTNDEARLYDEILASANAVKDDDEPVERTNRWLACMWELRRISLHPSLLGDAGGEPASTPRNSRHFLCQSAKLSWLLSQLDSIRDKGEKVLIFAVQKKLQEILAAHLSQIYGFKIPVINGDTKAAATTNSRKPNETRLGLIKDFSNANGFGICILSPIAAGAGLNIVAANHVVHLERHWNPAKEDQATDRAYRIGQTKDVYVYLPMLEHPTRNITTFDTGLDLLITRKKSLAGSLGLIPVQQVSMEEVFESVFKGAGPAMDTTPVALKLEQACKLSWEHFEALIAEVFSREADRVILTSRGRDHGTDVVVIGHESGSNILIQVKTTKSGKLDSEQAIREVEGSLRFFESKLGKKFERKSLHTNVPQFSRRTRRAAGLYGVTLEGRDWLSRALERHAISYGDVITRNAQRESL